jgi:drug/metabolite transporter (DMT)-like permease
MIYLILFILIQLLTQLILKKQSIKYSKLNSKSYILKMYCNPFVIIAYVLSFFNLIIWIIAISKTSLFTATLIGASSYIIIVFIDSYFFNEKINYLKLLGVSFILIGISLLYI